MLSAPPFEMFSIKRGGVIQSLLFWFIRFWLAQGGGGGLPNPNFYLTEVLHCNMISKMFEILDLYQKKNSGKQWGT